MWTIAFVTQKGGSGKSTLAIGLAVTALQAGDQVYVLETDKQGMRTNWARHRGAWRRPRERRRRTRQSPETSRRPARHTLAIIDTPGVDSVTAADLCLMPARPSPADIEAANPTLDAIRKLGRPFAFVLNQAPSRSFRLSEAAAALNLWGILATPYLVQRNDHQDALGGGLAVTEFAPNGKAAEAIRALWKWIKKRLNVKETKYDERRAAS